MVVFGWLALNITKLVSNLFFNKRIYGVNFKRIDDSHQCQIDNFNSYCQRNFQKNLKIGVSFSVAIKRRGSRCQVLEIKSRIKSNFQSQPLLVVDSNIPEVKFFIKGFSIITRQITFLVIHNILEFKKNSGGFNLVDLEWKAPYTTLWNSCIYVYVMRMYVLRILDERRVRAYMYTWDGPWTNGVTERVRPRVSSYPLPKRLKH